MQRKPGTASNSSEILTETPALNYLTPTYTAKYINSSLSELIRNRLYFPFTVIKGMREINVQSHKARGAREKPDGRMKCRGNKTVRCSGGNSWQGRCYGGKPTPSLQR